MDKGRKNLSGSVILSVTVLSILLASYCHSRAGRIKKVEKPLLLGTSHNASDQWPQRSEVVHLVLPFRAVPVTGQLLVLWNILHLWQGALCGTGQCGQGSSVVSQKDPTGLRKDYMYDRGELEQGGGVTAYLQLVT